MTKWTIRRNKVDVLKMAEDLNISETFAHILANRKIFDRKSAELYLRPSIGLMYEPLLFKDMKKGIEILAYSIKENKRIFIYGDYDADGVTSTVILYKLMKKFGADVHYYIPDRRKEGYGLNKDAVLKMKCDGCDLIFTCDNGIAAIEEAEYIYELGMKLIILDHHEPAFEEFETDGKIKKRDILPKAEAVIDAKREDCEYPYKMLCAGAMAYKFSEAFYKYMNKEFENRAEIFIFAAIATICDIVDLCDENRIIAKNGLRLINNGNINNIGLKALIECRGLEGKNISEESVGFIIGPCINAAGRLELASTAVSLFLEDDFEKAYQIAEKIVMFNEERKKITSNSFERISKKIETSDVINDKIIVVYDDNVDESIVGIVAGKLKEKYYHPVVVFTKSYDDENIAKGSARSIAAYNIFEGLFSCRDLFLKFGGHSMAAGLSLEFENVEVLRKRINESCLLTTDNMTEVIRIDKVLKFSEVDIDLAEELSLMQPFGKENEEAVFATKNVKFRRINFVGKEKNIMQIVFIDEEGCTIRAIDFKGYDKFREHIFVTFGKEIAEEILSEDLKNKNLSADIVYYIGINEYNNRRNIQLVIKDFRFL